MRTPRCQHHFSSQKRLQIPSCIRSYQFRPSMTHLQCFCHKFRTRRWRHKRINEQILIVPANSPLFSCALKKWTPTLIRSRLYLRTTMIEYGRLWQNCTRGTWHYRQKKATCIKHSTQPTAVFIECQSLWSKTSQYWTEFHLLLTVATRLE